MSTYNNAKDAAFRFNDSGVCIIFILSKMYKYNLYFDTIAKEENMSNFYDNKNL